MDPRVLREKVTRTVEEVRRTRPRSQLSKVVDALSASLWGALEEWGHLEAVPEQQVTVAGIIDEYFPNVIATYASVPEYARAKAAAPAIESLEVLLEQSESIRMAIGENNVRALENHRDMLQLQFGKTPNLVVDDPPQGSDDTDPAGR